jgi:hypothetical protein
MSSLADRQAELANRISAIDAEISTLDESFTELAASFSSEQDGTAAMRSAETIERRLTVLRREKALSLASQAHIVKQMMDEKEQQAAAERAARQAERQQHVDAVTALSAECDDFMTRLRGLLERRAGHLHSLGSLGANPAILAKLAKPALTRSACYHGLSKYIDINRCAPSSLMSCASTNVLVAGLGKEGTFAPLASEPLEAGAVDFPPATVPAATSRGDNITSRNASGGDDVDNVNITTNGTEPARRRLRTYGGDPSEVEQ